MNIENYIELKCRELENWGFDTEYAALYENVNHKKLKAVFMTLHYHLTESFTLMNQRLPTGEHGAHFWADSSRKLLSIIKIATGLFTNLKNTAYAFTIDEYYKDLMEKCQSFLQKSGGSLLPPYMAEVEIYYVQPIFVISNVTIVTDCQNSKFYEEKLIDNGSYANVYKYKDEFYNKYFAVKRAKKDLSEKELARFKREFEEMQELSSPYILEVYRYNDGDNSYIMEYMDYTLDRFIAKNNSKLNFTQRKNIVAQILKAFEYIHSKNILHRDISPNNILVKEYDDVIVVKISDFGLVKLPSSTLTTVNTEFKGYCNDPSLKLDGFETYNMQHEMYALTMVVYFVLTGRTNVANIKNEKIKCFVEKGLNPDKNKRFKSVREMMSDVRTLID